VTDRQVRITGLAGLASFVLIVAATFVAPPLWDAPETNATAAEVVDHVHDHRGRILASLFVYSIAMGLFLCFTAGLWTWLRRSEGETGPLSAAFGFGAVSLTTLILAGFVPVAVLAYRRPDLSVVHPLNDMTFGLLALSGIPTAVCMGAYAALVLRGVPLPRWTAWLGVLGAVAHVVIAGSFLETSGFFSLEGDVIVWIPGTFFAWILAVSAVLVARRPTPD
jgi:hypothetical protein